MAISGLFKGTYRGEYLNIYVHKSWKVKKTSNNIGKEKPFSQAWESGKYLTLKLLYQQALARYYRAYRGSRCNPVLA
jgi:hypothetical protein